jgi:hypothetical protein
MPILSGLLLAPFNFLVNVFFEVLRCTEGMGAGDGGHFASGCLLRYTCRSSP